MPFYRTHTFTLIHTLNNKTLVKNGNDLVCQIAPTAQHLTGLSNLQHKKASKSHESEASRRDGMPYP